MDTFVEVFVFVRPPSVVLKMPVEKQLVGSWSHGTGAVGVAEMRSEASEMWDVLRWYLVVKVLRATCGRHMYTRVCTS